jgi:hypothetical protein
MQVHPEDVGVFFNSKIPSYTQLFHNEYDGFLANQGFSSKNLHIDILYAFRDLFHTTRSYRHKVLSIFGRGAIANRRWVKKERIENFKPFAGNVVWDVESHTIRYSPNKEFMMLFIRTHGNLLIKASTTLNPKTALTTMLEYPLPVQSLLSLRKPSLSSALLSRIGKNYHCQFQNLHIESAESSQVSSGLNVVFHKRFLFSLPKFIRARGDLIGVDAEYGSEVMMTRLTLPEGEPTYGMQWNIGARLHGIRQLPNTAMVAQSNIIWSNESFSPYLVRLKSTVCRKLSDNLVAGVHLETQWGGDSNLQKNWGALALKYTNPKIVDIDLLWTGEQKNSSQPIRTHSDIVFSKTFNNVKVETAINASDLVRGALGLMRFAITIDP